VIPLELVRLPLLFRRSGLGPRSTACAFLALASCVNAGPPAHGGTASPQPAPSPIPSPPLRLPAGGSSVRLDQRTSAVLPGSDGAYEVAIDDITAGQVRLTLRRSGGGDALLVRSVREHETVQFVIDDHSYRLVIERLTNVVIGIDWAELSVRSVGAAPGQAAPKQATTPPQDERERTERLIATVERADVVFIRNGREHDAGEAAAHLRRKWEQAGDRIRTAEDFIEQVGSRSSQSGEPYRIRTPDGTERESAHWLRERLQEIDAARGRPSP